MIVLTGQLFYSIRIPSCLWFLARNKNSGKSRWNRRGEVLLADVRKPGHMADRTHTLVNSMWKWELSLTPTIVPTDPVYGPSHPVEAIPQYGRRTTEVYPHPVFVSRAEFRAVTQRDP